MAVRTVPASGSASDVSMPHSKAAKNVITLFIISYFVIVAENQTLTTELRGVSFGLLCVVIFNVCFLETVANIEICRGITRIVYVGYESSTTSIDMT